MKKVRFIPISMLALLMASCNFSTNGEVLPSHPSNTRPSKPSNPTALPSTSETKSTSEPISISTSVPTSEMSSNTSHSEPASSSTSSISTSETPTSISTSETSSSSSILSSTSEPVIEVVHVESISFPYESIDLEVGKSVALNPTILPAEADDKSVSWSSSNSNIVSVSDGLVTAHAEGEIDITATTNDGGLSAVCRVNAYIDGDDDPYIPDPTDESILIINEFAETIEVTLEQDYKQIYVNVPNAAVTINMNGHTIENSENSPIYVVDCDSLDISATKGMTSYIKDTRPIYDGEVDGQGKGAIYVDSGDLTLKGKGTLNIESSYYNGVHAKKDVEIKNLTLNVTAPNHAIKGKDSISVESGTLNLSCGGDGLHTDDSDLSSKGKQRGNVEITGGTLTINSMGDAIAAAYDAKISTENADVNIDIKTNKFSSYSGETVDPSETKLYLKMNSSTYASGGYTYAAYMNDNWYKASFKSSQSTSSNNGGPGGGPGSSPWGGGGSTSSTYYFYEIDKPSGASSFTLYRFNGSDVTTFDTSSAVAVSDVTTFNSNYDTITVSVSGSKISLSNWSTYTSGNSRTANLSAKGIKAENEIYISGGTIAIKAYDDGIHANNDGLLENGSTPLGNVNISGGSMTIYSTDDGIHADYILDISGGEIDITNSYEGLEGNVITVSGGNTKAVASDDGMNAGSGKVSSSITVSGGYLDIQVPASGDTDGIDSNGTYTQTGGVVIIAGPGSASGSSGGGSFALDSESTISLRGGTIAVFGGIERTPSTSGVTKTLVSSSTVSSGNHTITVGSNEYSTTLISSTKGCIVYSDQGSASLK